MTNTSSTRHMAQQNLLVATVNAALEQHLITLECEPVKDAKFEFSVGPYPAIGHVHDAGFDEVSIHAVVCPTQLGRKFICCAVSHEFRRFGEATIYSWLERRDGKYLQSLGEYHGTKAITQDLSALFIEPLGFGTCVPKGGYSFHKEFEAVFGRRRS